MDLRILRTSGLAALLTIVALTGATKGAFASPEDAAARAYVQAAIDATAMHRVVAAETALSNGEFPDSYDEMGLESAQLEIPQAALTWRDRQWVLTFKADAPAPLPGKRLVFEAQASVSGDVEWRCGYREFTSPSLRRAEGDTTVPPALLPERCQSKSGNQSAH